MNNLWFPYAQMKTMRPPFKVASASGCVLKLADGRELVDGISSWWCMIHGYNNSEINQAMREQAGKFSHAMLGGLVNDPAQKLSEKLGELTGLPHVFFCDSGSVGVEVSLKMAIQYWSNVGESGKTRFLALKKSYHGDTTGCMSVCDPDDGMHSLFAPLLPKQMFTEIPRGGFDASAKEITEDLAKLEKLIEENHAELAGFILEPIMQGAGGFNLYSPLYLKKARELCDKYNVLLIFDEVATGFGRTGKMFAAEHAEILPDIMILGKGLTAGYIGHAATLASKKVFDAFYDDDSEKCFMHGPTFMGNALACAVALKSIEIFERENYLEKVATIESHLNETLPPIESKSYKIKDVRVLGAMGAIEVYEAETLRDIQAFAAERGVWLRPFERFVYTMPPYIICKSELEKITDVMREYFA